MRAIVAVVLTVTPAPMVVAHPPLAQARGGVETPRVPVVRAAEQTRATDDPRGAGAAGRTPASGPRRSAPGGPSTEAQRVRNHRHEYLGMLSDVGGAVVDLSQAARDRAATERVRDFAEEARQEHEHLREKAADLAKANGIDLTRPWPDTPKERQELAETRALAARIRAMEGSRFESEYLSAMARIHEELAAELEIDRNNARGEGRIFLDEVIPRVRGLASEARAMADGSGPGRVIPRPAE